MRFLIPSACATLLVVFTFGVLAGPIQALDSTSIPFERRVSLDLRELELRSALKLIADQHGLNIVAGEEVEGVITGHFEGVPLREVLESLLRAGGYRYETVGDVVVVIKEEEGTPRWGETRVIELYHISGAEVRLAVEKLLSQRGSLQLFPDQEEKEQREASEEGGVEPRIVIVQDERDRVERITKVVAALDKTPKQLMIEIRMVETVLTGELNLGFDWNATASIDGNTAPQNLPVDRDRFRLGTLSMEEFQLILNTLDEDGNSRLVSNPRITTEDNREAKISVGTIFPVRTVSRFAEAGITQDLLTYEDKEINVELSVTPHVLGDSLISLVVLPVIEDIIGWTGEFKDQPITSKRELSTRVTVRDGETIAMGGLIKETEIETIRRVWLLGRIPILGPLLFTSTNRTKEKTDMLIFITPHIVRP